MPLNKEFDRYYARSQHHQTITLHDPEETIQSKLPVDGGELILTQTRLYLALGDRDKADGAGVPNIRLERSHPKAYPEDEYLEIAPRMGAFLSPGQTAEPFLEFVELFRDRARERIASATRRSQEGIQGRYDLLLNRSFDPETDRGKRKDTLRNLHASSPERPEAAAALAELYLEEGNFRAAVIWLCRAGIFDARFDHALDRVLRPRLPSREMPLPEWWLERHLAPLLERPKDTGPALPQRERIRAALQRIQEFRAATGRISIPMGIAFVATLVGWVFLLFQAPWITLGLSTGAALALGTITVLRARRRRAPKR